MTEGRDGAGAGSGGKDPAGSGGKGPAERAAYTRAGVDVAAGDRAVELIREAVESTRRPEVLTGLGGFAGAVAVPPGYREPVLVAATDGVGTKTAIARAVGRWDTIGIDLVAMCADDVVCSGAAPLFFLDYVAVGRLDPFQIAELVGGVAAGCREAGCSLIGGETAEHPGLMGAEDLDVAGCCVGVVERDRLVDATAARPGDAIIGLPASGLHSNGFSLVRALLAEWDLDLAEPYQARLRRSLGDPATSVVLEAEPSHALSTLGEVLLTPTRIYAPAIVGLLEALAENGGAGSGGGGGRAVRGLAHVTGGGLPGNVPRALPAELGARLDPSRWRLPSIMRLVGALGGLDEPELRATFNGGLGFVAVVAPDAIDAATAALVAHGHEPALVGEVVEVGAIGGQRYVEGPLEALG